MADISKITPLNSSTTYTLNARILGQTSSTEPNDKGGLTWNNLSGVQGTTINDYDTPSTSATWWYILRNRHTNTGNNYYTDLAIPFNANSIYYKRVTGNTGSETIANASTNNGWVQVLDQLNYNNYAPTKTGGGASGTWGINITGSSTSCTGNAATATKLATARTLWGQSFNGTANVSGQMNDVGPGMYLPAGQTTFKFLTSANYAGNGYFGKVGLSGNYADIDSNIGSHSLYVNGSTRVQSAIYRPSDTLGSSWVGSRSLSNMCIAVDASDSTSSVAYSLCGIKFPSKTFAICSERANPQFGIYGWNNSRTENGVDWSFYLANNGYFYTNTRIYGAVWNDYAEKRNIPEAQKTDWKDEECAAHPYAGRCVKENGDDTMSFSTERLQKGCKIISDTFGYCVGETDDCKTPIAVSGRVLAYLLEGREKAKEHIGDFVCSGPNGTVSIMTTEEYFKCPQAIVGTISAVPDYEEWGTGHVKVDGRIWIYVK